MRAASAQAEAARRAGLGMGTPGAPGQMSGAGTARSGFDLWVEGSYASYEYEGRGDRNSGGFGLFKMGADYLVSPGLLVGTLVQFDRMSEKSNVLGYKIEGDGWMAGPYVEVRLSRHLIVDMKGLWGTSDNSVSPFLTYTDSFDTARWLASVGLTGFWEMGAWRFTPRAQVIGYHDEQKAFVSRSGILIPEQSVAIGRLIAGPEVSYRYLHPVGLLIEPRAAVKALWTFSQDGGNVLGTLQEAPIDTLRTRFEAGLKLQAPGGTRVDLSAGYEGLGDSRLEAVTGKAQLTVPLN
jgi:hypothetical protein